jgi:hypothetical protein
MHAFSITCRVLVLVIYEMPVVTLVGACCMSEFTCRLERLLGACKSAAVAWCCCANRLCHVYMSDLTYMVTLHHVPGITSEHCKAVLPLAEA